MRWNIRGIMEYFRAVCVSCFNFCICRVYGLRARSPTCRFSSRVLHGDIAPPKRAVGHRSIAVFFAETLRATMYPLVSPLEKLGAIGARVSVDPVGCGVDPGRVVPPRSDRAPCILDQRRT